RPEADLGALLVKQCGPGERAVRRDVAHVKAALAHRHDGVLARNEIARQPNRAALVPSDDERSFHQEPAVLERPAVRAAQYVDLLLGRHAVDFYRSGRQRLELDQRAHGSPAGLAASMTGGFLFMKSI